MSVTALLFIACGTLAGSILFAFPTVAIWCMLVMSMVVNGPVSYFFPSLGYIGWGTVLVSLVLLFRGGAAAIKSFHRKDIPFPFFLWPFLLILFVSLLSTSGSLEFKEMFIASKNFFQFWSIPLVLYYVIKKEEIIGKIMKSILLIALFSTPLALVQYKFFAGMYPGDSVTGTFGGQIAGGGPNAAFAIFLLIQIAVILSLMTHQVLKIYWGIPLILWLLLPIFLTNSKAIILFIPFMFFIIYGKDIFQRPLVAITGGILIISFTIGILLFYFHQSEIYAGKGRVISLHDYVDKSIGYNIKSEEHGRLSRLAAITYWFHENNFTKKPLRFFFGHGLGATKDTGLIVGHVAAQNKYRGKRIGFTALPRLLWDIGLIGTFIFLALFIKAFVLASKLKKHSNLPVQHRAFMEGCQIAILFFLFSLPYQLSIINIQAFNAFSMFVVGYIGYWQRGTKVKS